MITVFFNGDGYYITGEGIEVTRRCSPALTERGDPIFQPIHHAYKVLYLALCELRDADVKEDIMVYNDSRIVDETNGAVAPIDDICNRWLEIIQRDIIPTIRPLVFFRKKTISYVNTTVAAAHDRLLSHVSEVDRLEVAKRESQTIETRLRERGKRLVSRLKQSWFNKENENGK